MSPWWRAGPGSLPPVPSGTHTHLPPHHQVQPACDEGRRATSATPSVSCAGGRPSSVFGTPASSPGRRAVTCNLQGPGSFVEPVPLPCAFLSCGGCPWSSLLPLSVSAWSSHPSPFLCPRLLLVCRVNFYEEFNLGFKENLVFKFLVDIGL